MSVIFIDGFFYHSYKGLLTLYFVPNTYIYVGSSIFRLKMNNNNIYRILQICTEQGTCFIGKLRKGYTCTKQPWKLCNQFNYEFTYLMCYLDRKETSR